MDLIDAGGRLLDAFAKANENLSNIVSSEELDARLSRLTTNLGPYGVDAFGLDPQYARRFLGFGTFLYRHYFRCETVGIENIPEGRCLLVANHSGQLPYDGIMLGMATFLEREPPRVVRSMVDRFVPSTPFVSPMLARLGQILGTPKNCRRLLAAEEMIQVFPEGTRGLNKTFGERYKLQRFGQGFVRLAIEMKTPIVPTIVVGAEEQAPSVANFKRLAGVFGMPAMPLTIAPLFGLLPLPVRYRIKFGAPIMLEGDANDEDEVMQAHTDQVRDHMQTMLDEGVSQREHIFW